MNVLKKIQDQPKSTRKIIFWITVIIVGGILLFTFFYSLKLRLEALSPGKIFEEYKPPTLEKDLEKLQDIKMPEVPEIEITDEELKAWEEAIMKEQKAREEAKEEPPAPESPQ